MQQQAYNSKQQQQAYNSKQQQQAYNSKQQQQAYDSKKTAQTAAQPCCSTLAVSNLAPAFTPTQMTHKGLFGWRYDCKSNYMITLVTEPRQDFFGTLREWGVERSEAGKAVYDAWQEIERRFPNVRATYHSIMPDHFHGIVYIMVDGEVFLEAVVQFFAETVERTLGRKIWCALYRDSICLAQGQLHRQIGYVLSNARRRWVKENNPGLFRKVLGFRHWRLKRASAACAQVGGADDWAFWSFARDPSAECWSLESGEEIVKPRKANRVVAAFGDGEPRQQAYDNKPAAHFCCSTLAVSQPVSQSCCSTLAVSHPAPIDWTALGNPFLLDAPLLISTRISTATPPAELDALVAKLRAKAARGAVIVSPFISPGEKAVKAAVLADCGAVIQLLAEGMGRYYKPGGDDFEVCAEGRMLQLSPFQPREAGTAVRTAYGKARFEWLNLAARNLADLAQDWKRPGRGAAQ